MTKNNNVAAPKSKNMQQLSNELLTALQSSMPHIDFTGINMLTGGASALTFSVEITQDGTAQKMIARVCMPGVPTSPASLSKNQEVALLKSIRQPNLFIPEILLDQIPGFDGYVMSYIAGETLAPKILRAPAYQTARQRLALQCGAQLALLHQTDISNLTSFVERVSPAKVIERYWMSYQACNLSYPVFQAYFQFLKTHPLPSAPSCLVHGDFRNGNIVVDENGLASILDWELSHIGNPLTDFGWISTNSWRFGNIDQTVGGFGSLHDLIAGYTSELSACPDWLTQQNVIEWATFGSLKWGIICITQGMNGHNTITPASKLEKFSIWRRTSETEMDLAIFLHGELNTQEQQDLANLPFDMDWSDDEYLPNRDLQDAIFQFQASNAENLQLKFHNLVAKKAQETIIKYYHYSAQLNSQRNQKLVTLTGKTGDNQALRKVLCNQIQSIEGKLPKELTYYLLWEAASQLCIHNPKYSSLVQLKNKLTNLKAE